MAERQLGAAPGDGARGSRGLASGLVWLMALPMNLITAALLGLGLGWLVVGPTGLRVLGAVCLVAFAATAPRPDRRPLRGLTREQVPNLYALMDQIAAPTGAPVPQRIQLSTDFNGSVHLVRRRPVLTIGLPLWLALPHQARVAVLGHELGHLAHRDLLSGRWPRLAIHSAVSWAAVGDAGRSVNRRSADGGGLGSVGAILAAVFLGGFRGLAAGYLWTLDVVNAAAARRREHLADRDAIQVGGSVGALACFDVLLARDAVQAAMTRAAFDSARPDLWAAVADATAGDTLDVRSRRRAVAAQEARRVDASHPATALRIRMVEQAPQVVAAVVPEAGDWARMDAELAPYLHRLAARAGDDVRYRR